MPPAPSSETISYAPIRAPGARGISAWIIASGPASFVVRGSACVVRVRGSGFVVRGSGAANPERRTSNAERRTSNDEPRTKGFQLNAVPVSDGLDVRRLGRG